MGSKSGDQVIGYKYKLGFHCVPCLGPINSLRRVDFNQLTAWEGDITENTPQSGAGVFRIDNPELFGGDLREGGVDGKVDVHFGLPDQPVNDYFQAIMAPQNVPAYRGVFSMFYNRFNYGNNPYMKPLQLLLVRNTITDYGEQIWYPEKAAIGDSMNAVHICYEALTSTTWSTFRIPVEKIDDASFRAAADTCFDEGLGLCFKWNKQDQMGNFLDFVLSHINGTIFQDPFTGLFKITLVRADYDAGTLPVLDTSNILSIESYERRSWGETTNEVTLVWRDQDTGQDKTVIVQDIANIQFQGVVVPTTIQMPGLWNHDLAAKIAFRELYAASSPLSRVELEVNRLSWALRKGDPFKLTVPEYGIEQQIFRVAGISTGTVADGKISLTAIEDVFGIELSSYVGQPPTAWQPDVQPAVPSATELHLAVEASYWDVQRSLPPEKIAYLTSDFALLQTAIGKQERLYVSYDAYVDPGSGYAQVGVGHHSPCALIVEALEPEESTSVTLSNPYMLSYVEVGTYAYVGQEMVEITAIDAEAGTATLGRGVIDTVPASHAANTAIIFSERSSTILQEEYLDTDILSIKLLERTNDGVVDIADAPALPLTMVNRYEKPYPPAKIRINNLAYPKAGGTSPERHEIAVTWVHRDRTQQLAEIINQGEGSIGPEAGTTYTVRYYDFEDNLLSTESGISGQGAAPATLEEEFLPYQEAPILITNPGAETGDTTGWTSEQGGLSILGWGYEGNHAFFGGPHAKTYAVSDDVILLSSVGLSDAIVDNDQRILGVLWWQQSHTGSDDACLGFRFLDGSDVVIGSDVIGTPTSALSGTWTQRILLARVPVGARKCQVVMWLDRDFGTNNDARVDSIYPFVLSASAGVIPTSRVELESVRGGLASYQHHSIDIPRQVYEAL